MLSEVLSEANHSVCLRVEGAGERRMSGCSDVCGAAWGGGHLQRDTRAGESAKELRRSHARNAGAVRLTTK